MSLIIWGLPKFICINGKNSDSWTTGGLSLMAYSYKTVPPFSIDMFVYFGLFDLLGKLKLLRHRYR
jgi:hypothetical protein